jgi:tRNA threonylcarbamoyl adenosine modification protein YjeE
MNRIFDVACSRTCSNERETTVFAASLARVLHAGDVVALSGPLGSGKTTFVRAIVNALHGVDEGTSPTFTFRHRYDGDPPVEHLDFYRIGDERELAELGLEEAFESGAIVLVEWWHNAPFMLPPRHWEVHIEGAGDAPRTITVTPPAKT